MGWRFQCDKHDAMRPNSHAKEEKFAEGGGRTNSVIVTLDSREGKVRWWAVTYVAVSIHPLLGG